MEDYVDRLIEINLSINYLNEHVMILKLPLRCYTFLPSHAESNFDNIYNFGMKMNIAVNKITRTDDYMSLLKGKNVDVFVPR